MVSSLLRTNPSTFLTLIFSVVTMSFLNYLTASVIEQSKTEIFHFSRSQGFFNLPSLDLSLLGGLLLQPKDTWKYLGFIFDYKLTFHKHIDHYANKAISTVKCMKLLGNSLRGISPLQKRLLYRCCVLPIALYGFQL